MTDDLDDLLDALPPSLARKVAAALAPDADADHDDEAGCVTGYAPHVEPCPHTSTLEEFDSYIADR